MACYSIQESWDGKKWVYDCQHGPDECAGNLIEVYVCLYIIYNVLCNIYTVLTTNVPQSGPIRVYSPSIPKCTALVAQLS